MRLYDPDKDELLMLYWFLNLRADPVEFENLFAEPLRHLTQLLLWAKNSVSVMIETDEQGIRFAAWLSPYFSGAEFGAWSRKDARGTKAHLRFMDECYEKALTTFPVLIGLTKQPNLHNIHIKMGYEFKCEIPALFDGSPLRVYIMTKESRANRFAARRELKHGRKLKQDLNGNGIKPLRSPHRKVRKGVSPRSKDVRTAAGRSAQNGGSERTDPHYQ